MLPRARAGLSIGTTGAAGWSGEEKALAGVPFLHSIPCLPDRYPQLETFLDRDPRKPKLCVWLSWPLTLCFYWIGWLQIPGGDHFSVVSKRLPGSGFSFPRGASPPAWAGQAGEVVVLDTAQLLEEDFH